MSAKVFGSMEKKQHLAAAVSLPFTAERSQKWQSSAGHSVFPFGISGCPCLRSFESPCLTVSLVRTVAVCWPCRRFFVVRCFWERCTGSSDSNGSWQLLRSWQLLQWLIWWEGWVGRMRNGWYSPWKRVSPQLQGYNYIEVMLLSGKSRKHFLMPSTVSTNQNRLFHNFSEYLPFVIKQTELNSSCTSLTLGQSLATKCPFVWFVQPCWVFSFILFWAKDWDSFGRSVLYREPCLQNVTETGLLIFLFLLLIHLCLLNSPEPHFSHQADGDNTYPMQFMGF